MDEMNKLKPFCDTIGFRTVSDQSGSNDLTPFLELADYLEEAFPLVHSVFTRERVNSASLLYTLEGSEPEADSVMLTAHLDVVPAEENEAWYEPPFSGSISRGRVWGRGTIDYKLGLPAMLQACEDALDDGFRPKRTLILSFGHDEEVGGLDGAAEIVRILKNRGVRLSSVLDEGGYIYSYPWLDRDVAVIGLAEKGYLTLRLTARGVQGHASVPHISTAAGRLCRCLGELEKQQFPPRLCGPVKNMIRNTRDLMNDDPAEDIMSVMEGYPSGNALIRTTTAITMIRGSMKENVIPAEPSALVNFRAVPGDTSDTVMDHVTEIAENYGIEVKYEDMNQIHEPSRASSMDTMEYSALKSCCSEIWPGIPVLPGIFPAATDSRHYGEIADNVYRFEPVSLGQQGLRILHSHGESVSAEDYLNAVRFYRKYIKKVCSR
ncbi:MAG: M20/M25/M40 family metallo-hydrolase [Candidatus Aegiribacteria sp.]|nr:M20/M25/M40 family metallo-hydrolase [Candidatus Aegiribacteria sp.]MBD3293881.1 M20/M25/M40 family metallo-hydrolase [Candidatus Fermentibacteria bacterium]